MANFPQHTHPLNGLKPRTLFEHRPGQGLALTGLGLNMIIRVILSLFSLAVPMAVAQEETRFEFTRMIAHWDQYDDADYLEFVREAEPEVVQLGFYGAHFWSLVQTPQFGGYPAHFPVQGWDACGDWFTLRNREVHQIDPAIKVIGHFNIEFLVGDPDGEDGPRGFFQWYRDGWDEAVMGVRPVANPTALLERDERGVPHKAQGYAIGGMHEYRACLRNPGWQQVLKGWVKQGIRRGVDGFMINYFYRGNCLCEHCVSGFKAYLAERFTAVQLSTQFDIGDLDQHTFGEIVSWHDPKESTPLRREMLRFSQISNKAVFDDVFVRHGRTLKPDLLVGQWNHLGDFSQIAGDERCLLPAGLWGKDESYLWYSTGGAANATDLPNRFLGEGTLQARYIRGAFADKPFTLGKYESTRIRVAIAELAANGGAPMGFYTRFKEPTTRAEIVRYYQFLKRYDMLYRGNRPYAEAALLFPRSQVHQGKIEALARFKELGRTLLDAHVLFDVVPDDQVEPGRYADTIHCHSPQNHLKRILKENRVRVDAPFTVRVSASQPAKSEQEIDLHFVNYNRVEPPKNADGQPSPGSGIIDEKPIPIAGVKIEMPELLNGRQVQGAVFLTPEIPDSVELAVERSRGRLRFELPEFLVYAVVRLELR
ncbi:MAG: hypothetical protein ACI9R3_005742 [Verrucomicrobiales bacterium]|jgi:hypothetical protein